jgi:steroid delta-isomerase-like uncharacterized protein
VASRNVETFRSSHQAFNRRDFDAVLSVVVEGIIYQDRARNATFRGRYGFMEFMQGWVSAFSNAQIQDPVYTDAGDVVVAQFVGRGVNDGALGPLPATGKPVEFNFCEIVRFDEKGMVVTVDAYYDQLSILVQLGHVPAIAQGATA